MKIVRTLFLPSLLFMFAASMPIQSQVIYKTVDENGNVTYTDSPSDNAEVVDLPTINSQAPLGSEVAPLLFTDDNEEDKPIKYTITITEPLNDTAIPPGQRRFFVAAEINPQPAERLTYTLIYDGNEIQSAGLLSFVVEDPFRGSHSVSVVAKREGKIIASSESITIHVIRPTVAR